MKFLIFYALGQSFLLLFLLAKDKNDGEKALFREQKWNASDIVLLVLSINVLELLFYYLPAIPFICHSIYQPILKKNPHILHSLILLSATSILLILIFRLRIKQSLNLLGFNRNNLMKNLGFGMAVAFSISLISAAIDFLKGIDGDAVAIANEVRNLSGPPDYILYYFVIVILGPVVEESIYRGMLYSPFRKKYGPIKAIIIISLFFAIVHLKVGFGFTFIYGIALGVLYKKQNR